MNKTWLTADWHCGESRLDLMSRPYKTQNEMIDDFVYKHNILVKPEDNVIVVGDAVYQKTPEYLPHIRRFNGIKTLIRGNHDRVFTDEQLQPYFNRIIKEGDGIELDIEGIPCFITHYPSQGRVDKFNIVGHIHAAWKYQLNMINVGVDVHHFRPIDMATIPFYVNAISKFYDNDVWAAYMPSNEAYKGKRGMAGQYFKPTDNI